MKKITSLIKNQSVKVGLNVVLLLIIGIQQMYAQCPSELNKRILVYQPNGTDYNCMNPSIQAAFTAAGYNVTITNTFPPSILSSTQDVALGYEAFFMMGSFVYTAGSAAIVNTYLTNSGKVYINWEVSCCIPSQVGAIAYINALTTSAGVTNGALINNNMNPAAHYTINGCNSIVITGAAYQYLAGVPVANRILANIGGMVGAVNAGNSTAGVRYTGSSLNAGNGVLAGLGDINVFFNGTEPSNPVDPNMVNYIMGCLLCSVVSLPAELIEFSAKNQFNQVLINWQTASERNNESFIVQRSVNGSDWINIDKVEGAGNSNSIREYSSIDFAPLSGLSYYRLKQIDFDGEFIFSGVTNVNRGLEQNGEVSIHPNPTTSFLTLKGSSSAIEQLEIYTALFENVTSSVLIKVLNESSITLNLSNLPNGIYYIKTKNVFEKVVKL